MNKKKKYECFKILVNVEKKKKLVKIAHRGIIVYSIIFIVFIATVIQIYYSFVSKGEYDNLLLASFFLSGAFFIFLPIIIDLTKFYIYLKKELTN